MLSPVVRRDGPPKLPSGVEALNHGSSVAWVNRNLFDERKNILISPSQRCSSGIG